MAASEAGARPPGSTQGNDDCIDTAVQADVNVSRGSPTPPRSITPSSPRVTSGRKSVRRGSVVIVDKNPVFRAGLEVILARSRFRTLAKFSDLAEINFAEIERRSSTAPLLVLVGIDDVEDGDFSWVSPLIDKGARVVILSDTFRTETVLGALEAGVRGCLRKDEIEPIRLISTLELIYLGGVVIPQGLSGFMSALGGGPAAAATNESSGRLVSQLSHGELLILDLLTQGASNKDIARKLNIAEATVKVRIMFLLRKIRVNNRTQAAMWATQHLPRRLLTNYRRNVEECD